MSKLYFLFDDVRNVPCDIIGRTYNACVKLIDSFDLTGHVVILDNDLGCVKEGYHLLDYMIEVGNTPKELQLVTSNPVARQRMRGVLKSNGYTSVNDLIFKKGE